MTLRTKHLGYGLLVATVLINLWFYQATIFGSLHPDEAARGWEPHQSWEFNGALTDGDEFGSEANMLLNQIYWLQTFATVMFDVLALSLSLFFIKHDSK